MPRGADGATGAPYTSAQSAQTSSSATCIGVEGTLHTASTMDALEREVRHPTDDQLADVRSSLAHEVHIRDGALAVLGKLGHEYGHLRDQVVAELEVASARVSELSARIGALEHAQVQREPMRPAAKHPARFLRPQAIRPTHGIELNAEPEEELPSTRTVSMVLSVLARESSLLPHDLEHLLVYLCTTLQHEPHAVSETQLCCRLALNAACYPGERIRTLALRTLRYLVYAFPALLHGFEPHLDIVLSRSLVAVSIGEREQALKLCRTLLLQRDKNLLRDGAVSALVSSAQETDALTSSALETLAELSLYDTAQVARNGGFGPLFTAARSAEADKAVALVHCLSCLIDAPSTRSYLWPSKDLTAVLSAFSDCDKQLQDTAVCITKTLLTSWPGLFYVYRRGQHTLRSIVAVLLVDNTQARGAVLNMLISLYGGTHPDVRTGFLALLFQLLVDAGLVDTLVQLLRKDAHSEQVRTLVHTVHRFSRSVLPPDECVELYAFPQLFQQACQFGEPEAGNANHALHALDPEHKPRRIHATVLDDFAFRTLLRDTLVPATRECSAWNVPALINLCQGALHDPHRFEEAVASKIIKRLLSFMHPSSRLFSTLPADEQYARFGHLACAFFGAMLSHVDGQRILAEDTFLSELRECFEQLLAGFPDAVLSPQQLSMTLSDKYFDILGVITKSTAGLELLAAARIFSPLYMLCDIDELSPVTERLVYSLDYTHDAHPRIFLSRALTCSAEHVRQTATEHLGEIVFCNGEPQCWAMRLVITQLFDPVPAVQHAAAAIVHRTVTHAPLLAELVAQRPPPALLGSADHPVFLHILAHEYGYEYLERCGYVEHALEQWHSHECNAYVVRVELVLAEAFQQAVEHRATQLPLHLYGALCATEAGARRLQGTGYVAECIETACGLDTPDTTRKAAVWALGAVGTSPHGFALLREHDAVSRLVRVTLSSPVVSVRATCFSVLVQIGSMPDGAAALRALGWVVKGRVCLPTDIDAFLAITTPPYPVMAPQVRIPAPDDADELQAYTMLSSLGNSIVRRSAARVLERLRTTHPELFGVPLLCRAISLMEYSCMHVAVRRSIWELFDGAPLSFAALDEIVSQSARLAEPVDNTDMGQQHAAPALAQPSYMYQVPAIPRSTTTTITSHGTIKGSRRRNDAPTAAALPGHVPRSKWPLRMSGFPSM